MKKVLLLYLLFSTALFAIAQKRKIDSLRLELGKELTDTARFNTSYELSGMYYRSRPDSCIILSQQAYLVAEKNKWEQNEALALINIANAYVSRADYAKGLQYFFRALRVFESTNNLHWMVNTNLLIGSTYIQQLDHKRALPYLNLALKKLNVYAASHKLTPDEILSHTYIYDNLGEAYLGLKQVDSAERYVTLGYEGIKKLNRTELIGGFERDLGEVQAAKGKKEEALRLFRDAVKSDYAINDAENASTAYLSIAGLYHRYKQQDSAEFYAQKAIDAAATGKYEQEVLNAAKLLYSYYDEDHNIPQAYKYFKIATAAKDSVYSQDKVRQMLSVDFDEKQHQQEIASAQERYRNKVRTYVFIAGLVVLLFIAVILWRSSNHRKKANELLQKQKEEIQSTLSELKSTQAQLIQSEKMASLGELTAGIAHEIQNPLNFVNNFSDVNQEMLEELKAESTKPKAERDEQLELDLINDLMENEAKINHHGKRAEAIVKGMLEHSRASTGHKEPTDLNKLADEYFRLAYHGLRAKDKTFNAELVMAFDENLPPAKVIPQDVGRVLLNLFNNAFYSVNQKMKTAGPDYKPTVEIITSAKNNRVEIRVKDNGVGIPGHIKEKILQPFFTTKPAGEGTGLGLSLSYDIIVKAHGGQINIESKEGEGAEFIIDLPIT